MDIRLHHHLAQEFYRQQMLQRIPGNSSSLGLTIKLIHLFLRFFFMPAREVHKTNMDVDERTNFLSKNN